MVLTDEQIIRALNRLENGWPPNRQLVAIDGSLCLIASEDMQDVYEDDLLKTWSIPCDGANGLS